MENWDFNNYNSVKKIEIDYSKYLPKEEKKKKGGINSELTEVRVNSAKMLGVKLGHFCKLTKGWTAQQIYQLQKDCEKWGKNPQALWWKKYKVLKNEYGKNKKEKKILHTQKTGTLF